MKPRLVYFDFPVRAEVSRLLFTLAKVDFDDTRISYDQNWAQGKWKDKCTFGQVPILEVDGGKVLAQSAAIDRYVARLTGQMPEDPLELAVAEQAYFFCEDLFQTYYPTFRMEESERLKARQALLAGALGDKLKLLSKLLESRAGKFIIGNQLTHGDLQVFCHLGLLNSGWIDGFPSDLLDSYPVLKEFRDSVASVPEIAAFYSKETDDIRVKGFRPPAARHSVVCAQ